MIHEHIFTRLKKIHWLLQLLAVQKSNLSKLVEINFFSSDSLLSLKHIFSDIWNFYQV